MLDPKTITSIVTANAPKHKECDTRHKYYRGKQVVAELAAPRIDGRPKTVSKTNFVKYAAGMYGGFLTSVPVNYTLRMPDQDKTALEEHYATYRANNLDAADTEHLVNCLLYGYSVEVHSFDDSIRVEVSEPLNWSFVHDEHGSVAIAVYKAVLPAFSMYQGEILEKDKILYYAYDKATIDVYEETDGKLAHLQTIEHQYGRLPIVVFRVSKDSESFFSDSFLTQCDLYDVLSSAMVDDVKYSIDSFLAVKGINGWAALTEKGKDGVSVLQKMKEAGLFPLPEGADAQFLTRNVDTEKFRFALRAVRENIHRMANVPDLVDRVNGDGAITSISGIALRLLFQGMEQQGSEFAKYFEEGLRDRMDLFNRIWSVLAKPLLEGVNIRIQKNIPQNEMEWAQYIKNLDGLVSTKDQLSLLPFIVNPELAYFNLLKEKEPITEPAVEIAA